MVAGNSTTKSVSIKTRLLLIMAAALTGMILIAVFALQSEKATLLEDRKVKTRHLVEGAHSLLGHFYDLQQKGVLSEDAAKDAAIKAIKALRYEQTEYFWLQDYTTPIPKMLMHPTVPALDGKVLDAEKFNCATSLQSGLDGPIEKTDGKKNLFVAFNEATYKSGQGFVTYIWPKPKAGGGATDKLYTKLSFVKKFDGWNWLIGSGIYLDDVDRIFWNHAIWLIGIIVTITALIGGGMIMVIRRITRSLNELESAMYQIQTSNDLSGRVSVTAKDEIGRIGHSFNQMIRSFQEIIQQVVSNSHSVMQAAGKLSEASHRVASRSQSQSDAAASMAATMEQMTMSIDQVAEHADEAHNSSLQNGELSSRGSEVILRVVDDMRCIADTVNRSSAIIQGLGQRSDEIFSIVQVIKDIADQTNLLALNAAIEAARAGEQGRGFAVVADEVRKLAERTSQSTQMIAEIVEKIQSGTKNAVSSMEEGVIQVNQGVELAGQAGAAINQISSGAQRVSHVVSDISNAIREQSTASSDIARNVERVAQMSDENHSAAEETAATARNLEDLAAELESTVAMFKA